MRAVKSSRQTKVHDSRPREEINDDKLVRLCIEYAQAVASYHALFVISPEDISDKQLSRVVDRYHNRAKIALAAVAARAAQSCEGLEAKARTLPIVLKEGDDVLTPEGKHFLLSLAKDVRWHINLVKTERAEKDMFKAA